MESRPNKITKLSIAVALGAAMIARYESGDDAQESNIQPAQISVETSVFSDAEEAQKCSIVNKNIQVTPLHVHDVGRTGLSNDLVIGEFYRDDLSLTDPGRCPQVVYLSYDANTT